MANDIDLSAYFRRIGFSGDPRPDLQTLTELNALHVASIPFEGLDPLLGRPVLLDLPALQAKLIESRRGGYCFEQNTLLKAALEAIGFEVAGLGARVVIGTAPDGPLPHRGHMVLLVDLVDGSVLVDVGLGGMLQDAPLRLEVGEQTTPAARYRIEESNGLFTLSFRAGEDWRRAYVFTLEPQYASDYDMANWFYSTHPASPFRHIFFMQRLSSEARYSLVSTRLTEQRRDGQQSERQIKDAHDLAQTLDHTFGIEPPVAAEELFARVSKPA
jgi:N-hydroxyarylamine O-acetyltransferase